MSKAKIGVVGFCMGGRLALLSAIGSKEFSACSIFYGRPESDPASLAKLSCPVLGIYGGADQGIGPDQVDPFREGLEKAGVKHEVKVYEGAGHAFLNETGRNYHPAAAKDAWAKLTDFFAKHLKA
jgi:carboxymethylenebutenolidase